MYKRGKSMSNDSNQSDEDHLPLKQEMSKKHRSFKPAPSYNISIGYGKEPTDGKNYQKKGTILHCTCILIVYKRYLPSNYG